MKKIHLIRHAKSSWEDDSLLDIDRPLNKRGICTCEFMAPEIVNAGCRFINVFCSPAVRARSTIELIGQHLSEIEVQWQIDEALYTFNSANLHRWCRSLDESISEIVLVGHNPAFTNFCNELSNSGIHNIPTCGYSQLVAKNECVWQKISETPFELTEFLKPKQLMKGAIIRDS